jgi:hypothetical protein
MLCSWPCAVYTLESKLHLKLQLHQHSAKEYEARRKVSLYAYVPPLCPAGPSKCFVPGGEVRGPAILNPVEPRVSKTVTLKFESRVCDGRKRGGEGRGGEGHRALTRIDLSHLKMEKAGCPWRRSHRTA